MGQGRKIQGNSLFTGGGKKKGGEQVTQVIVLEGGTRYGKRYAKGKRRCWAKGKAIPSLQRGKEGKGHGLEFWWVANVV